MTKIPIPLQLLDSDLYSPKYAYPGDAGVDLCAREDLQLKPFQRALVPTGIALAIPVGCAGFVLPRSGLAIKHGVSLVNSPGLIDSNYRGEIKVVLINLDPHENFQITRGDRVAQLIVMPVPEIVFSDCEILPDSARGIGGFGSSG